MVNPATDWMLLQRDDTGQVVWKISRGGLIYWTDDHKLGLPVDPDKADTILHNVGRAIRQDVCLVPPRREEDE